MKFNSRFIEGGGIKAAHISDSQVGMNHLTPELKAVVNNTMPTKAGASRNPGPSDDKLGTGGELYTIGNSTETTNAAQPNMLWVTAAGETWRCVSAEENAAVWVHTSVDGSELKSLAFQDIDYVNQNAQITVGQVTDLQLALDAKGAASDVLSNADNISDIQGSYVDLVNIQDSILGKKTFKSKLTVNDEAGNSVVLKTNGDIIATGNVDTTTISFNSGAAMTGVATDIQASGLTSDFKFATEGGVRRAIEALPAAQSPLIADVKNFTSDGGSTFQYGAAGQVDGLLFVTLQGQTLDPSEYTTDGINVVITGFVMEAGDKVTVRRYYTAA